MRRKARAACAPRAQRRTRATRFDQLLLRHHLATHCLNQDECRGEVGRHHLLPVIEADVEHRPTVIGADAVQRHVDASPQLHSSRDDFLSRVRCREVDLERAATSATLGAQLRQPSLVPIRHQDLGTGVEIGRDACPPQPTCPSDDHGLVLKVQPTHEEAAPSKRLIIKYHTGGALNRPAHESDPKEGPLEHALKEHRPPSPVCPVRVARGLPHRRRRRHDPRIGPAPCCRRRRVRSRGRHRRRALRTHRGPSHRTRRHPTKALDQHLDRSSRDDSSDTSRSRGPDNRASQQGEKGAAAASSGSSPTPKPYPTHRCRADRHTRRADRRRPPLPLRRVHGAPQHHHGTEDHAGSTAASRTPRMTLRATRRGLYLNRTIQPSCSTLHPTVWGSNPYRRARQKSSGPAMQLAGALFFVSASGAARPESVDAALAAPGVRADGGDTPRSCLLIGEMPGRVGNAGGVRPPPGQGSAAEEP